MPVEYLVPVYEPNHTYDCVVYDAPQNGTLKNGQASSGTIPKNTNSDYVNVKSSSTAGSNCSRRCWIVTGIVLCFVCLILTLVNVIILLSIKAHKDHTSLVGVKETDLNTSWEWGSWGPCGAGCGYGLKSRDRYCGNQRCLDGVTDKDICHAGVCEDSTLPVGFSTSLGPSLEDVSKGTTIAYKNVDYNRGRGYNKTTGIFTCPQAGAYLFIMFVQGVYRAKEGAATQTSLALMIDGHSKRSLVSQPVQMGQDETGGNSIVVYMDKGQKAWIETYYDDNQSIYSGRTSFSGVLLR